MLRGSVLVIVVFVFSGLGSFGGFWLLWLLWLLASGGFLFLWLLWLLALVAFGFCGFCGFWLLWLMSSVASGFCVAFGLYALLRPSPSVWVPALVALSSVLLLCHHTLYSLMGARCALSRNLYRFFQRTLPIVIEISIEFPTV